MSKAIRDAFRHWRREPAIITLANGDLRRLVAEGQASGRPVDGKAALTRLRAKYEALSASRL